MSDSRFIWGIDLGGTKIDGVILDTQENNNLVCSLRLPTEQDKGYQHICSQIVHLVSQLSTSSHLILPKKIGLGIPGKIIAPSNTIRNSNLSCMNGKAFVSDLEQLIPCQFFPENDANCYILAEAVLGNAKSYNFVFGMTLGTGVGGALIFNKKIRSGLHRIAGEWGHNPLSDENELCYCGNNGCVESICSGSALENYYFHHTGNRLKLPAIVAQYGTDKIAYQTINRLQYKFAQAIASVINILDPDAIVIGGSLSNLDILYTQETREKILKYIFNDYFITPLLRPQLSHPGAYGAAILVN